MDKKILQKMYPFLQYFLVRMTGFPPVAALADKQSTGLFGPTDKMLRIFLPISNPTTFIKQKEYTTRVYPLYLVRMTGFEPTRISSLEPETSASAVPPHPRIKCKMQNAECKIVNSQFLHGKETRSGAYSSDKSYFSACSAYYLRICALI